ncbi:MAG TPA: hypothetical protein VGL13_08285, partial [Polyangiaceae bacterium]
MSVGLKQAVPPRAGRPPWKRASSIVVGLALAIAACSSSPAAISADAGTSPSDAASTFDAAIDAASPDDGGGSPDHNNVVEAGPEAASDDDAASDTLQNASFEQGVAGWTLVGDTEASYVESLAPHTGQRDLAFWGDNDYSTSVEQTLGHLQAGTYTLRAWLQSSTT